MSEGSVKYTHDLFIQEMEIEGSVETGDLLEQRTDHKMEAISDSSIDDTDAEIVDGVALEEQDTDGKARVLLSGLVELVDDHDVFGTGDWDNITNAIVLDNYPLELDSDNVVVYIK